MSSISQDKKQDEKSNPPLERHIEMDNHKITAEHLENALKYHRETAKFYEEGDHEKAHKSSIFALGHCSIARELLREDAKKNSFKGFR